ncbi:hypothetical protein [Streptomyces sp. CB03911]|uniref:hypothetical protein n=1 Tax=Streptomyces sp. CB03911 TaxID=1804758 RepID=UPI00093CAEAB|nr:hypothetical protein [Streptomyces sp. CB03911]OKI16543.1 hypothetical protein A6A07_11070 [Streptomyces sp. CB03911]
MARIRSIKPELRTSITVSAWPMDVRYFFVLLWGYLDDYGRGVDDELLISSDCFPRDRTVTPDVVDGWLELMADSGPVCRYEVDGRRYLHCPNWGEHQKPQHPAKMRIPPCPEDEPEPFKTWRSENPQRIRTRSRKSREDLTRFSKTFSGTSPKASGGPSEGIENAPAGRVMVLHRGGQAESANPLNPAGQGTYGEPPEDLMSPSGDSTEILTPEQGAGSREQGSRENNTSVIAEADLRPARADVEEACALLADLVEANGSKRPTITAKWRDAARLMLDKDRIALDDVLGAIRWSQADEFWCSNVLSMPKLREKYDTLRLRAQRGHTLAATGTGGYQGPYRAPSNADYTQQGGF